MSGWTPEEEADFERRLEIVMSWPSRIEAVGGPYCGAVLFPHDEAIGSVTWSDERVPPTAGSSSLPSNFFPQGEDLLMFFGPLGPAGYRLEKSGKWMYDWRAGTEVPA